MIRACVFLLASCFNNCRYCRHWLSQGLLLTRTLMYDSQFYIWSSLEGGDRKGPEGGNGFMSRTCGTVKMCPGSIDWTIWIISNLYVSTQQTHTCSSLLQRRFVHGINIFHGWKGTKHYIEIGSWERHLWDIVGVAEVKRLGFGETTTVEGHKLWYKGEDSRHSHGVGLFSYI